jgi:hypothetical protein
MLPGFADVGGDDCPVPLFLWQQGIVVGRTDEMGRDVILGSNEVAFEMGSVCMSVAQLHLQLWLVGVFHQRPCLKGTLREVWDGSMTHAPGPSTVGGTSGDLRAIRIEVDMHRKCMLEASAALRRLEEPVGGLLVMGARGLYDLCEWSIRMMKELVTASRWLLRAQFMCFADHDGVCLAESLLFDVKISENPDRRAATLAYASDALACAAHALDHVVDALALMHVMQSNNLIVDDWVSEVCVELKTRASVLLVVLGPVMVHGAALSASHVALMSVLGYANTPETLARFLMSEFEDLGPVTRVSAAAGPWLHAVANVTMSLGGDEYVVPQNCFALSGGASKHMKVKRTNNMLLKEAIVQSLALANYVRPEVDTVKLGEVQPWGDAELRH